MPNYGTVTTPGVRIIPTVGDVVYVHTPPGGLQATVPISSAVQRSPYRAAPFVTRAKRHLHVGTLRGWLVDRNADGTPGSAVPARTWAERLFALLATQADAKPIQLSSRDFQAADVRFTDDYDIELSNDFTFYTVELPWVEVA